jgi:hypothetical protein
MTQQTPLIVFYSWQSDLPKDTNQRVISGCIKSALIAVEENNEIKKLIFDEATRDEAGSPDIPMTIFNKISASDIFICDITTINNSEITKRKTPNPNVLIELGYAISILGWERIIMVFNKNFGSFPSDLPFDMSKRRTTLFTIANKTDKNGKTDLTAKLTEAIETIIKKDPPKTSASKTKTQKATKREKDVTNLKNLMSGIHLQTFDYFIDGLPNKVLGRIFFFWYSFQGYYDSNAFHIYDQELGEKLKNFRTSWGKVLDFGHLFQPSSNSQDYFFNLPFDAFTDKKTENDFYKLTKEAFKIRGVFKDLLTFIRENYLEVDIDELSQVAIRNYVDHEKDLLDDLERWKKITASPK